MAAIIVIMFCIGISCTKKHIPTYGYLKLRIKKSNADSSKIFVFAQDHFYEVVQSTPQGPLINQGLIRYSPFDTILPNVIKCGEYGHFKGYILWEVYSSKLYTGKRIGGKDTTVIIGSKDTLTFLIQY